MAADDRDAFGVNGADIAPPKADQLYRPRTETLTPTTVSLSE